MPVLFGVMRGSDDTLREFLFQQLTLLVSFLRQHVRKYLPDILGLVHDFWIPTSPLMPHILRLLSELSGDSRLSDSVTHPSCHTSCAYFRSCQVTHLHRRVNLEFYHNADIRVCYPHAVLRLNSTSPLMPHTLRLLSQLSGDSRLSDSVAHRSCQPFCACCWSCQVTHLSCLDLKHTHNVKLLEIYCPQALLQTNSVHYSILDTFLRGKLFAV